MVPDVRHVVCRMDEKNYPAMGDNLTRRDFIIRGTILASILGGLVQLDGKDVSEDERDVAKEAMAIFIGSFPAGQDPEPNQVADKGRLAIRAWRELKRGG